MRSSLSWASSVITDRRRPRSVRNSLASWPRGPVDSTATAGRKYGWNQCPHILDMFPGCCGLGCGACRRGGTLGNERIRQNVHDGGVPRKAATFPPRDQCETVWSLAVCEESWTNNPGYLTQPYHSSVGITQRLPTSRPTGHGFLWPPTGNKTGDFCVTGVTVAAGVPAYSRLKRLAVNLGSYMPA